MYTKQTGRKLANFCLAIVLLITNFSPGSLASGSASNSGNWLQIQYGSSANQVITVEYVNAIRQDDGSVVADLLITNKVHNVYDMTFSQNGVVTKSTPSGKNFFTVSWFPLIGKSRLAVTQVRFSPSSVLKIKISKWGYTIEDTGANAGLDLAAAATLFAQGVNLPTKSADFAEGLKQSGLDLITVAQKPGFDLGVLAVKLHEGDYWGAFISFCEGLTHTTDGPEKLQQFIRGEFGISIPQSKITEFVTALGRATRLFQVAFLVWDLISAPGYAEVDVSNISLSQSPGTPNLITPVNGSTTNSLSPHFDWYAPAGASGYVFELSNSTNFFTVLIRQTIYSNFFDIPADLNPNGIFYWRVRAFNEAGSSSPSVIWSFQTPAIHPSPVGPLDGATFISDVTLPDNGPPVIPGQTYIKTWRVRNSGTSIWDDYKLVFVSGDQMGAASPVNIPYTAPGQTADISITIQGPNVSSRGDWQIVNQNGTWVKGGSLWVIVRVSDGPLPSGQEIDLSCIVCPSVLSPGQTFRPTIRARVNSGQLLQSRGDMLLNTDGNLYGIKVPHIGVVGTVNAGQTYDFTFYADNPITAPSSEGTYETKWRVWRNGNWAGPEITIRFDVRNGGGTRPNPPTLVSPGNWYVSYDGSTPPLCASASGSVQYWFQIYESHDIPESGWISNNCWTPPGLGWYGYQWHVKVRSTATGLESDWSETWHFEISSQDVVTHGIFFSPGSPSAADEVRVWFCVEDQGGVEIYANTATDGSDSGEWQWIAPVIGVCNLDENDPSKWPQWHTRALSDGIHLIRGKAWRGNYGQPGYKEGIVETTYTLQRRRPSNIQLINPGQDGWFNTRTITFRWNPEESLRVNNFTFYVSTNPDPTINPVVNQTLISATREYTYTFSQDYPSLYWRVQACNELGCGDAALGHFGIDRTAPSSSVNPLSPTTFETVFQVSWTGGTDNASGIRWCDVQYRDDDRGTWVDWQTNVTNTVAIFTGQPGHKYYFRVRCLDNAGNLESWPGGEAADTFTIVDPTAAPATPWWNPAYAYKRNVLLSNNVASTMFTGYPVHLHWDGGTTPTAAELFAASQTSNKGDDFRILYNNATELPHWVQKFSSAEIDIWFKTQADINGNAADGTAYQVYYGNPNATNPPNDIYAVIPPGRDANTIGLWYFTEGSGSTFMDASGHGHHGSLINTYTWGEDAFGPYIEWPGGSGSYGEIPTSPDFDLNMLTLEAWVYPTTWGSEETIFYRPLALPDNCPGYKLAVSNRKMDLQLNCAAGRNDGGDLTQAAWTHIAATYDGSNMRIYRNGALIRTVAYNSGINSTSGRPLYVGGDPFGEIFAGRVRYARLSNSARTDFSYASQLAAITIPPSLAVGDPIQPPAAGSPNLALLNLSTYPNTSGGVLVQAVLQNQGNLNTQNGFYTDLYLNHAPTGSGDYTGSLQFWVNDPIAAGAVVTLTTVITDISGFGGLSLQSVSPASENSGTLYAQADSTGAVAEPDNANNIYTSGTEICLANPDAYEDDDTPATSKPITLNQVQTHNFNNLSDSDWVAFTAQSGITYTVSTSNLGVSSDTYLYVYATNGTTLLASNDDSGGSLASQVDWTAPTTGIYHILVQHWNPNIGGCGTSYNVAVQEKIKKVFLPLLMNLSSSQITRTPTPTRTATPTSVKATIVRATPTRTPTMTTTSSRTSTKTPTPLPTDTSTPTPTPTHTPTLTPTPNPNFGGGADGDLIVGSGPSFLFCNHPAAPCTSLTATANLGQKNLAVADVSSFYPGKEVLIIQMQGVDAGQYEFNHVATIGSGTFTLQTDLQHTYSVGGNSMAQVIGVPHWDNVTIQNGGNFNVAAWSSSTGRGGVIVFRVRGNLIVEAGGRIDVTGMGFYGGPGSTSGGNGSWQGDSPLGPGAQNNNQANGGGGGGGINTSAGNGGGGGYGTSGSNGEYQFTSYGGATYGLEDLSLIYLGSGGGGSNSNDGGSIPPGNGGPGGGIMMLFVNSLQVDGVIAANGADGSWQLGGAGGPNERPCSGGGGSGGSILIKANNATLGTNLINATGGNGQLASAGDGGSGRIRIEYGTSLSGTTSPAASIYQNPTLVP